MSVMMTTVKDKVKELKMSESEDLQGKKKS